MLSFGPSLAHVANHLSGEHFESRLVADDAPFERRVIGAASLRFVNRGGDCVGAAGALERLVERLDVGVEIALALEDVALDRHGLAMLAQVERRIDDVVMAAPRPGQNRRVAGPRDAREVDDRAVREHRAALDEAGEIRNRAADCVRADDAVQNATGRRAGSYRRASAAVAAVSIILSSGLPSWRLR